MNTPVSRRDENFAKKLQLECPNFCGFVMEKVNGKRLSTYVLKEKGDGTVSVILTYHVVKNKDQPLRRHLENKSSFTKNRSVSQKCDQTTAPIRKKKSPSRRRRDKARFREFLEKKRLLKNRKTDLDAKTEISPQNGVSISGPIAQCTPPDDVEIPLEVPDTVTVTAQVPQEPAITPETDPVIDRESAPAVSSPVSSPVQTCICSVCQPFVDKDPLVGYYAACDNCDAPNTEEQPLKPCARCLFRAYCSKKCQKAAWRAHHKEFCTVEAGETAKLLRSTWNNSREIWLRHKLEPHKLSWPVLSTHPFPSTGTTWHFTSAGHPADITAGQTVWF